MGSDQQGRYQEFPSHGGDQTSSFLDILLEYLQPHLSPENLCRSNKDGFTFKHSCRESHSLIATTSCMWSYLQHTHACGSVFVLQSYKTVPMVHLTCSGWAGCSLTTVYERVSMFVITHHHDDIASATIHN